MPGHDVVLDSFLLRVANVVEKYATAYDAASVVPVMDAVV